MGRLRPLGAVVILLVLLDAVPGQRSCASEPPARCAPDHWGGIYPTVLTPFTGCCGVDTHALECQLRYELAGGVSGLLVLGTYGEGSYASMAERAQVISTAARVAHGCVPVVVGIHTACFEQARAQLLQARDLGAAAVLVKYLGDPHATADRVLGFYASLCNLQTLPIFYYHYPAQTGLRLTAEDVAAIIRMPGVVGIKESSLNLREMQAHINLTRGHGKAYFCSTALMLTQFLKAGGCGAMCPEAVFLPAPTVQCYHAAVNGRADEARAIQAGLFSLAPIYQSLPTPPAATWAVFTAAEDLRVPLPMATQQPQARMKAALTGLGVPTPTTVKCPVPPLTAHDLQRVQAAVRRVKQMDWQEIACRTQPVPAAETAPDRIGMFLRTGGFLLGPKAGKDWLGIQGDGKAGFIP
jgi:4-hydroxy-tetrahydrodipicolinate synthase